MKMGNSWGDASFHILAFYTDGSFKLFSCALNKKKYTRNTPEVVVIPANGSVVLNINVSDGSWDSNLFSKTVSKVAVVYNANRFVNVGLKKDVDRTDFVSSLPSRNFAKK